MSPAVLFPPGKLLCDITLHLELSCTVTSAVGDSCELPLGFGVNVGAFMEGTEELVLLKCMGAEEALLALFLLKVEGLNGSGQAPLLCNQAGNVIMHVMELLELSCDSPVFLGLQIVIHGGVGGVLGK